jgi:hypothetical protein
VSASIGHSALHLSHIPFTYQLETLPRLKTFLDFKLLSLAIFRDLLISLASLLHTLFFALQLMLALLSLSSLLLLVSGVFPVPLLFRGFDVFI